MSAENNYFCSVDTEGKTLYPLGDVKIGLQCPLPQNAMAEQSAISPMCDAERQALATFGIKRFNSEKFENSDDDSVLVRSPVKSNKRDLAFATFCDAIPIEDAFPQRYKDTE